MSDKELIEFIKSEISGVKYTLGRITHKKFREYYEEKLKKLLAILEILKERGGS